MPAGNIPRILRKPVNQNIPKSTQQAIDTGNPESVGKELFQSQIARTELLASIHDLILPISIYFQRKGEKEGLFTDKDMEILG